MDVFCETLRVLNPPSALRRYQVPWSGSRSLPPIFSCWSGFCPLCRGCIELGIYDGCLPNRHIWRHLLLAASTARTSTGARAVMASAGSGKSYCLLRWHQATVVSTGLHQRIGSGVTVAGCLWEHCEQSFQIRCPCSRPLPFPLRFLRMPC